MTQSLPLTRGAFNLLDDTDYGQLAAQRWLCTSRGYAARVAHVAGKRTTVYLHRLLLNAPPQLQVDHINGNKLDNRRRNLRLATPQQNRRNGKATQSSSEFKGVTRRGERWQARICINHKIRHLGYYDTALEASLVYDLAARRFFGSFARLNHPHRPRSDDDDQRLNQILSGTRPPKRPTRRRIPRVPKARSDYRGVYWERGRWRAILSVQGRQQHLGYFGSELAAALAHDAAARTQFAAQARLNFPPAD